MPRAGRKLLVVAAVAVVIAATAVPAQARAVPKGPTGDAFYAPPDPLPHAEPGALIRAQPMAAPAGARAWRVLYHSRTVHGDDIAVSGIVVAPIGAAPKGGRPIVSWAHGTTGLADACTPSKQDNASKVIPFLAELLGAGDVVVATDYEGLGPPGLHPYLVGESEGRGVLDVARAARHLHTDAGDALLVYGLSQGGHAALFAGELAHSYAPELHLLGVAAGAPPANLELILPAAGMIKAAASYLVMGAAGFHAAYPTADPEAILTPAAMAKLPLVDQLCAGDLAKQIASLNASSVIARSPSSVPPWPSDLRRNSAGHRAAGAPLFVFQGGADTLVLPPLTDAFVHDACARHDIVDYKVYPGASHGGVLFAAKQDILEWLAARVKGDAARSICGTPSAP